MQHVQLAFNTNDYSTKLTSVSHEFFFSHPSSLTIWPLLSLQLPLFHLLLVQVSAVQWAWREASPLLAELFQQARGHEVIRRRRTHETVDNGMQI
jgi:hypothetical protein